MCIAMITTLLNMIMPRNSRLVEDILFDAMQVYLVLLNRIMDGNTQQTVIQLGGELSYEYLDRIIDYYNNRQFSYWTTYTASQGSLLFAQDENQVCTSIVLY